ncbi:MAG: glycosyltransferase family 4 protein [Desulfobacteraceae bacterium]|nr:glycosyltransferase family 4 protein [Desulfobacteraceae bacterium]
MRILLLTRYARLGASSRLRALQYLPYFESFGWQVDPAPFFSNAYLEKLYAGKPTWKEAQLAYWGRIRALARAGRYDLVWVEKEILPFLPAAAERMLKALGIPYMVDYDDALFHRYDLHRLRVVRVLLGRKIDEVMKNATLVVAGNQYLADRAGNAGAKRVEIVPTVIDLTRYPAVDDQPDKCSGPLVVGWIGTPGTSRYLYPLKNVFKSLQSQFNVRFAAVGATRQSLGDLPVESWHWSEDTEVDSIRKFDIGIMPLEGSPWERGKCGYKLIQYMACGLPVVASPVGVNAEIVEPGVNGFLAGDGARWRESLAALLADVESRWQMGRMGRKKVESRYCLQVQAPRIETLLRQLV